MLEGQKSGDGGFQERGAVSSPLTNKNATEIENLIKKISPNLKKKCKFFLGKGFKPQSPSNHRTLGVFLWRLK
jgi:hypothetical protein